MNRKKIVIGLSVVGLIGICVSVIAFAFPIAGFSVFSDSKPLNYQVNLKTFANTTDVQQPTYSYEPTGACCVFSLAFRGGCGCRSDVTESYCLDVWNKFIPDNLKRWSRRATCHDTCPNCEYIGDGSN